jgi:hypothetical protein
MRRKKKERRGWRKKRRKLALPNAIPGFVAGSAVFVVVASSTTVLRTGMCYVLTVSP